MLYRFSTIVSASSGKTRVVEYLALLGYHTVPEVARVYLDNEQSKGRWVEDIRSDEAEFQKIVLKMKIDAEERIPPDLLIFLERGIPDSDAYYQICGQNPEPVIRASRKRKYKGIFLLDPLPFYRKDYARVESEKDRLILDKLLFESYSSLGYDVIRIPVKPNDERAKNYPR